MYNVNLCSQRKASASSAVKNFPKLETPTYRQPQEVAYMNICGKYKLLFHFENYTFASLCNYASLQYTFRLSFVRQFVHATNKTKRHKRKRNKTKLIRYNDRRPKAAGKTTAEAGARTTKRNVYTEKQAFGF